MTGGVIHTQLQVQHCHQMQCSFLKNVNVKCGCAPFKGLIGWDEIEMESGEMMEWIEFQWNCEISWHFFSSSTSCSSYRKGLSQAMELFSQFRPWTKDFGGWETDSWEINWFLHNLPPPPTLATYILISDLEIYPLISHYLWPHPDLQLTDHFNISIL